MVCIKDIGRFFVFIAGGIVAIIVGAFMIRGTMHMWDSKAKGNDISDKEEKDK